MLHHQRQQADTCMYHSVYALTGDETWLEYARDSPETCADDLPFMQRLALAGALLFTLYGSRADVGRPATRRYWQAIRQQYAAADPLGFAPLLVVFKASVLYHCVAAEIDLQRPEVRISDSDKPGLQVFTWAEFLRSPYAKAYRIELLAPLQ